MAPVDIRRLNGWAVTAGAGSLIALVGAFLPLLSVGGREVSGSTVLVGNAVAWSVGQHNTITLLLERRDVAVLATIAVLLLATLCAIGRFTRWAAGLGVLFSAGVFHLLLAMVQRAENLAVPSGLDVNYSAGAMFCLAGPLLSLVGFVAVLARRH
ncbi:MAG TPA: hypothetical protein PLV13_08590 [Ilumatobacteraceae bacterium]|nr:hypothetical protein [Ilumatobacteraceae bacterium]